MLARFSTFFVSRQPVERRLSSSLTFKYNTEPPNILSFQHFPDIDSLSLQRVRVTCQGLYHVSRPTILGFTRGAMVIVVLDAW